MKGKDILNWDIEGRDLNTTEWVSLSRKSKNNEEEEVEVEGRRDGRIVNNMDIKKKWGGNENENGEGDGGLPILISQKAYVTYALNTEGDYNLLN